LHIFIDESGTFTGYHDRSVSVVGALAVPDGKLEIIKKKYEKLRTQLPMKNGEVKGSLLSEQQVDDVVSILARNNALFEITALDLGFHAEIALALGKKHHADEMLTRSVRFHAPYDELVT
jgi:urease accessory protein UreE